MSADETFSGLLKRLVAGERLEAEDSSLAFGAIMSGEVSPARMAGFLTALAMRKPSIEEIVGAVRAMRGAMRTIRAPEGAIDLCGTGGDGLGTLNVSTAAAFAVAGCGVPVAKHGNRNMSSQTGTADVLEVLGVKIDLEPAAAEACLNETGFCFLFAPAYHTAMRHVAPVRRELGFRTVFNLLGPLSNPAGVKRQMVGVFSKHWGQPLAQVLKNLGSDSVWVVHGSDGLDEITLTGPTSVAALENGSIRTFEVSPEDAGLARSAPGSLKGGDADANALALRGVLEGRPSPYRDVALLNAAAALIVAGKAKDLKEGVAIGVKTLDSGAAAAKLKQLVAVSNG